MIRFAIPIRSFPTKSPAITNPTFPFTHFAAFKTDKKRPTTPYDLYFWQEKKVEQARIAMIP
jgi:hypothetical protein